MSTENDTETATQTPCPRCVGCGQLANSDDREPWFTWLALPLQSAVAVTMGLVKPEPCDECGGTGKVAAQPVGLEDRYDVQRRGDARGKHSNCRYFVLDPRHDQFARVALWHYAEACETTQPELARDLTSWLNRVTPTDQDLSTQPAGEHHTLNLTGEGNAPAEPVLYWCPTAREIEMHPGGGFDVCCHAPELHEPVLAVVYAAIRQQVAEEIAAAHERAEDDARRAEQTEGAAGNKGAAQTWHDLAAGYMRSAELAREIGRGA
jgi:hypothetical protein